MYCGNNSMNNKKKSVRRRRHIKSRDYKGAKARSPKKVSRRRSVKRKRKSKGGYVELPTAPPS